MLRWQAALCRVTRPRSIPATFRSVPRAHAPRARSAPVDRAGGEHVRQDLQRDVAFQPRVAREVDLVHPPAPRSDSTRWTPSRTPLDRDITVLEGHGLYVADGLLSRCRCGVYRASANEDGRV